MPVSVLPPTDHIDRLIFSFVEEYRRTSQLQAVDLVLSGARRLDVRPLLSAGTGSSRSPHPDSTLPLPARRGSSLTDVSHHLESTKTPGRLWANTVRRPGPHPLATFAGKIFDNGAICSSFVRLAALVPTQGYLSWLAHPCSETRANMSNDMLPTSSQLSVPHPQWVDLLRWPLLRDAVIQRQDVYATLEFMLMYTKCLRLRGWAPPHAIPHHGVEGAEDGLLEPDPVGSGELWLRKNFITHACKAESWALGLQFAQRYPELVGFIDIIDEEIMRDA